MMIRIFIGGGGGTKDHPILHNLPSVHPNEKVQLAVPSYCRFAVNSEIQLTGRFVNDIPWFSTHFCSPQEKKT